MARTCSSSTTSTMPRISKAASVAGTVATIVDSKCWANSRADVKRTALFHINSTRRMQMFKVIIWKYGSEPRNRFGLSKCERGCGSAGASA